jgi:mRNA-degrading endonuclease RelE of RelBE toxin-antitoxin system
MNFLIKAIELFLKQIKSLDEKSKRIIRNRIQLIKLNPYRYKRIHSKKFSKIFRVRLNLGGREVRMVYVVLRQTIIFVCLLDRKRKYRDLEKYLEKI